MFDLRLFSIFKLYLNLRYIIFIFVLVFLVNSVHASTLLKESQLIDTIRIEAGLDKKDFTIKFIGKDILINGVKNYRQEFVIPNNKRSLIITNFGNTAIIDKQGYVFALYLKLSTIENFDSISKLKNLQVLKIFGSVFNGNKLSNIKGVWKLSNLKELDLSNNEIESFNPVDNVAAIHYLNVSGNAIRKLEGIGKLSTLN